MYDNMRLSQGEIKRIDSLLEGMSIDEKEDYLLDNDIVQLRVCNNCGKIIEDGYVIYGCEQYCSDTCVRDMIERAHFDESIFELINEAKSDVIDSYWTVWNE